MLELYHGTTSVCTQKARLMLAEKGLEWKSQLLNPALASTRLGDLTGKPQID